MCRFGQQGDRLAGDRRTPRPVYHRNEEASTKRCSLLIWLLLDGSIANGRQHTVIKNRPDEAILAPLIVKTSVRYHHKTEGGNDEYPLSAIADGGDPIDRPANAKG